MGRRYPGDARVVSLEVTSAEGYGLATVAANGMVLDTWFPKPRLGKPSGPSESVVLTAEQANAAFGLRAAACFLADPRRAVSVIPVKTVIEDLTQPPRDPHDVYLRLHLLSHRLIRPHGANLDGMFGILGNVAWTSFGPCLPEQLEELRWASRSSSATLEVRSIDKLPRMTDYIVPEGVRIADANRVRLGAHLGRGTTVLHEGFCNFNAGTLGSSMVEGRISAGVVVGDSTDIGGGASIMGTLSGGGKQVVSIGERCLLGANSGTGIALGDDCVIEAGCYVTAGTLVRQVSGEVVKAVALSGKPNILFRRHSQTGAVEAIPRNRSWGSLNPALHA
ncbi:2,3,4,5-tetrahydropyridine-2,6-dicarboxylate N-succinyltransferase [Mesorhizobium sp.]|uniref:2,3,4,5-tetrahydropyridine-2,6-dicarboxylate N-succinyltransferase n=1 Tax=Mesorhizobium sp. TaxID=1871066 RepID=UPI000FE735AF|nr:2,3,4,5-tetrahydropyridine-2,6-dicarboxylate N-succinyltransferase [Mesorhizobium sp.]RWM41730.1 MAG: 2,3,4,5-tetrahydropyridine-2,6-dicarboxylate N-succinyltransferase [Mesorhizobium sp.]RWM46641.1 MAG: 2,3,4,5-tetrahydropyridine-2,6-dicarboxylate N-succinyltransferase [Mesorhizobium sp.]RWM47257.1 MAG: 2,3,4,5-tetrahydropyridine-2,6-dicarboxylate N-succinyltransferase [Mesorhizobium sp.]TIO64390.1 MAG: 2,3,4,5-tetrahydropyridine-2,6-dicarboxylate N-succinyltransferase [Mesorhizobium sp.]T